MTEIDQALRKIRRRMIVQMYLERLVFAALAIGALLLMGMAGRFEQFAQWSVFTAGAVGAVIAATVWTFRQAPNPACAAARIDQMAGTCDRFVSGMTFARMRPGEGVTLAAVGECADYIAKLDLKRWTQLHVPEQTKWLAVPLAAMLLLTWHHRLGRVPVAVEDHSASSQTAAELERMAGTLKAEESPEVQKIAQQIREAAERLQAPNANDKARLRELSALEAAVRSMQQSASTEVLKTLAETLKKAPAAAEAAQALQKGDPRQSADALDKLAQKTAGDPLSEQQVEQALQEAEERLKEQRAAAQLAEINASSADASEALRRLAEMLREMGASRPENSGERRQASAPMDTQTLQRLLQALQNLKYSDRPEASGKPQSGSSEGMPITVADFSEKPGNGETIMPLPSGQPGSERDQGTTKDAFGKNENATAPEGTGAQITGALGEGESLQELVTSTGDDGRARQRYRELHRSAAAAAEATVLNENVPLGSRFFVRRYFESIRPRE